MSDKQRRSAWRIFDTARPFPSLLYSARVFMSSTRSFLSAAAGLLTHWRRTGRSIPNRLYALAAVSELSGELITRRSTLPERDRDIFAERAPHILDTGMLNPRTVRRICLPFFSPSCQRTTMCAWWTSECNLYTLIAKRLRERRLRKRADRLNFMMRFSRAVFLITPEILLFMIEFIRNVYITHFYNAEAW